LGREGNTKYGEARVAALKELGKQEAGRGRTGGMKRRESFLEAGQEGRRFHNQAARYWVQQIAERGPRRSSMDKGGRGVLGGGPWREGRGRSCLTVKWCDRSGSTNGALASVTVLRKKGEDWHKKSRREEGCRTPNKGMKKRKRKNVLECRAGGPEHRLGGENPCRKVRETPHTANDHTGQANFLERNAQKVTCLGGAAEDGEE